MLMAKFSDNLSKIPKLQLMSISNFTTSHSLEPEFGVAKSTVLKRYEASTYDCDMTRYLRSLNPAFVKRMDVRIQNSLLKFLSESDTCRLLIPAIGSGRILDLISPYGERIDAHGIDFNPMMLRGARNKVDSQRLLSSVQLLEMDIYEIPDVYASESFDVIIWEYSGCVVAEPIEAWKIMLSLLAPGGTIVYNDYIGAENRSVRNRQRLLRDAARTIGMRWFQADELPDGIFASDARLLDTNGIFSAINEDVFENTHAIVWDPTYGFSKLQSSLWFNRHLKTEEIELHSVDEMQSNVSAVFRKFPRS